MARVNFSQSAEEKRAEKVEMTAKEQFPALESSKQQTKKPAANTGRGDFLYKALSNTNTDVHSNSSASSTPRPS
ncbi:hypothetical protein GWI33_019008 [Rhynchophorus ferrugineus]|uniref:Uncharacterized protein n=1 Tax=Rhynchophorus ferrugineus TaxID=354439 RepID=A0A834HWR8_RHYFE|nr:hypothetical protein GWI33_019008 [Rhynchophorus ferrugineus]